MVLAVLLLGLTACSTLPQVDRAAQASEAIPISDSTTLGRIANSYRPAPDQSGFRLMPLGSYSLDTRVQLAQRAQVSLDVQYYHLQNDESGRWLMRALRDAAQRGVRVRLLLDDFYTSGEDELLLTLAAHPNIEVRIFNPFCCIRSGSQLTRFIASIGDLKRVNHRMHNKLFLADGAMAVVGGRNVANEYFLRNAQGLNFIDVDAFLVGWVVPPLQNLFDRYWNADAVYPIQALARSSRPPEELRQLFDDWTGRPPRRRLRRCRRRTSWATARSPRTWTAADSAWCGVRPMRSPTTPTSPSTARPVARSPRPASPTTCSRPCARPPGRWWCPRPTWCPASPAWPWCGNCAPVACG